MQPFSHLHVHTAYSMLDGAVRIKELFARCKELNITSVAITDHGNMYGAVEFVKAAVSLTDPKADWLKFLEAGREFDVKPIIGCEVYITDDMHLKNPENKSYNHLILLAKNKEGYKNLIRLVSFGYIDGMYYKPRIDFKFLKQYASGLVCLSACLAGHIPQALLKGDLAAADEWAKKYKTLFGDDFYIELQDHRLMEQRRILPLLREVAIKNGIKMVATNDVHYLNKDDALMQKVLQNISYQETMSPEDTFKEGIVASDEGGDYFPTDEFYLKSGAQMAELFKGYEGVIENSLEIADKCDCRFFAKEKLLPLFSPPDGSAPGEYLKKLCDEGLRRKYKEITPQIQERADYELGVINNSGYVEYFLIVWDFIHFAENNGVAVGPGRGSGVGSLVAYALGITKVDPLKYNLIFERFLNPERVSNPDFDIDFCVDGREKVIDYVVNKYGEQNVSQIITFSTLAAKAAVKDVGRVFDRPYAEVDKLTKLMPKMMGKAKIENILGVKKGEGAPVPELIDIFNSDPMAAKILDMAMKIEGLPRQTGMHAAGVIICKDRIFEHIPMAKNGDGIVTTEFNMNECEELGLLKMDFLGLTTLTDISKTLQYVKEGKGIDIDFYAMDYDDKGVFALIGEGDTHAVFQLESEGMKRFMKDLKPTSLEDIIAGISLYRPGPMDKIPEYVKSKRNPKLAKYDHALLEPILNVTYGVMVYQEQVMDMVRSLAGYSMGRADTVRKMMSKKKHEEMAKEREVFLNGLPDGSVKGCIKNGIPQKVADKIYDDMSSFASYAFNKSHAAAYAFLAYQTAYLKLHHTAEFIAAVLNNRITSIDEVSKYLMYLKEKNITVLPPNINKSFTHFSVESGAVRIGLAALKGVGEYIVEYITDERKKGEFKDFEDFVRRMHTALSEGGRNALNKKLLESLIYAGAFDCLGVNRCQLINSYDLVSERIKKEFAEKASGQMSFFDGLVTDKFIYPALSEYTVSHKLNKEKEVAGVYLSAHPLDEYSLKLKEFSQNTSMLKAADEETEIPPYITLGGMLTDANLRMSKAGREFGIGVIEDLYGSAELLLMGEKLNRYKEIWVKDILVTVSGKVNVRDDGAVSVWVDRIDQWLEREKGNKKMCIYFESEREALSTLDEVKELLKEYPGEDEVYISYMSGGEKIIKVLDGATVMACDMLKNELLGNTFVEKVMIK